MCWKKYDNKAYIASIDAVIARVEVNQKMLLLLVEDQNAPAHADAVTLTQKYAELIARLEKLKVADIRSHTTILKALREVAKYLRMERENILAENFYPSLHGSATDNIFLDIEPHLQLSESIVEQPPQKAKKPSDDDIVFLMILPETPSDTKRWLVNIYIRDYREQCDALREQIHLTFSSIKGETEQLQAELSTLLQELIDLEARKAEVLSQYQSGMLSKSETIHDAQFIRQERSRIEADYMRKQKIFDTKSKIVDNLYSFWNKAEKSLFDSSIMSMTREKLVKFLYDLIKALKRFLGFIKGEEGDFGENYDFSLMGELISSVGGDLSSHYEELVASDTLMMELESLIATGSTEITNDDIASEADDPAVLLQPMPLPGDSTDSDNPILEFLGEEIN